MSKEKNLGKKDRAATWCLVLAIATWPLVMTVVLWFPALIVSIVMGIKTMRQQTPKKKLAIAGLVIDFAFILVFIVCAMHAEELRMWLIS